MRDGFLARLEHLFRPVDGWGAFRKGARQAAVVFVLYRDAGVWMVPFVRRRADMRDHPGQVALPGGGVKAGESAWEAGQREVAEEIGVPVGRLVPLGAGEPIYAAVTNFSVVPFVAFLPEPCLRLSTTCASSKGSWPSRWTGSLTTARGWSPRSRGDSATWHMRKAWSGA